MNPAKLLPRLGLLLLLALAAHLTACNSGPSAKSRVHTKLLAIDVMPKANLDHPVPLDLVIIYDPGVFEALLKLPAKEWFDKREQYKKDFPAQLQTWEWELVPGQVVPFFKLPGNARKAVGALVFANYLSPGNHRARIDPYEGAIVRLTESEMLVLPLN